MMSYSPEQFNRLALPQQVIVSLLAILGRVAMKTHLLDALGHLSIKVQQYLDGKTLQVLLDSMTQEGVIEAHVSSPKNVKYALKKEWIAETIQHTLLNQSFDTLSFALQNARLLEDPEKYYYRFSEKDEEKWIHQLRIFLLQRQNASVIKRCLDAAYYTKYAAKNTGYAEALGPYYYPEWLDRLHPSVVEPVLQSILQCAPRVFYPIQGLCDWTLTYIARKVLPKASVPFVFALSNILLLSGRLEDALALRKKKVCAEDFYGRYYGDLIDAAVCFLRGEQSKATAFFSSGLKTLRRCEGSSKALIPGFCGDLYVLACMREEAPPTRKKAAAYLAIALKRMERSVEVLPLRQLEAFLKIQAGLTHDVETPFNESMLTRLFQCLFNYWTKRAALPQSMLVSLYHDAKKVGFRLIMLQAAALLKKKHDPQEILTIQEETGLVCWHHWFTYQEPWEIQLSALTRLPLPQKNTSKGRAFSGKKRLCWVFYNFQEDMFSIEPFEQKCNAKGLWLEPKLILSKNLHAKMDELNVTDQDRKMATALYTSRNACTSLKMSEALLILVGHPFIFLSNAYDRPIELLHGVPELIIQENKDLFELSLNPIIPSGMVWNVLLRKETPSQFKVIEVTDSVKRIADILRGKLKAPLHAKEHILKAIHALSGAITIQSSVQDPVNIEQVPADDKLHVHLLPQGSGLRSQIWVRPLGEGAYYAPGSGAENVISEINRKPIQTQRNLTHEKEALQKLLVLCPIFRCAEKMHDQWFFEDPEDCLELLLQLQETQASEQNLIIAWPEGEKFKVSRLMDSKHMNLSIKLENNWFEANGALSVNEDQVFQLRQLLELVKNSPGRFIALEGNAFLALTEEFHHRLRELSAVSEVGKGTNGARVHTLATGFLEELAKDVGKLKTDPSWKNQLKRLSELENFKIALPTTLQTELRDYQIEGFYWLSRLAHWGVGACLADDMGLGKTVQALTLLLSRAPDGPALVIAPTSVCPNWLSETARFAPTLRVLLFGSGNREKHLSQLGALDLVIVSYGLFQQAFKLFSKINWHTIILDEAQSIKNAQTKRAQAVTALSGNFRVLMTGTPLENHLGELWSLFRFINPGLLGSLEQFNQRFAIPIERDKDTVARNRLRKLVHPFILRRTKNKVLSELPPRIEILRTVELSMEEKALYEALRQTAIENIAKMDEPPDKKPLQILAEIMKLRKMCCHPQLVVPELNLSGSKLAAFGELLDELLENNHKALVFSQFVSYLSIIRSYLDERKIRYQYLDGATPMHERKNRVDRFQAGDADLFLISLKAGGTGLNLTAADYVVHMDPWWNPAVEDQAADRAHRIGQSRTVTIYRLVAKHTIEEAIVRLHAHKRDLADSLLEGSDMSHKISAREMLALLTEVE